MTRSTPHKRRKRLRRLFLGVIVVFVLAEIIFLSPSSIEEAAPANAAIDPELLTRTGEITLASGIPVNQIPEYSIDEFNYVSTQAGEKQWKLMAEKAFLYNTNKLCHSKNVEAFLYDPEGKATRVTGLEAKYFVNQRDLEIFGNVKTVFPDGFELYSDYMRYFPAQKRIEIPLQYHVKGGGQQDNGQYMTFESDGFDYLMATNKITLAQNAKVFIQPEKPSSSSHPWPEGTPSSAPSETPSPNPSATPEPDYTRIESDRCVIYKDKQIAYFTMNPARAEKDRFVHIFKPTLFARSRRADLRYGDFSTILQYLTAYEDVLIKETGKDMGLRYATGGRADFDHINNVIILTDYPQAYQDDSTVTGDVIRMHRDTDIIEVEHSNGFNSGK